MMIESWEVRWFGEGTIPFSLQQWAEENNLTTQPVRTDYYLRKGSSENGIKWREGNIQIKYLVEQGIIDTENYHAENYKKWSFSIKDGALDNILKGEEEWFAVTKRRDMAKWKYNNGKFEKVELGHEEKEGFEIEISAVICQEKLWWTVAYEATGTLEILIKALKSHPVHISDKSKCYGYAEWLEKNFK